MSAFSLSVSVDLRRTSLPQSNAASLTLNGIIYNLQVPAVSLGEQRFLGCHRIDGFRFSSLDTAIKHGLVLINWLSLRGRRLRVVDVKCLMGLLLHVKIVVIVLALD